MVVYEGGNIAGLQQKLTEFNAVVPQPLTNAEQKEINNLITTLKDQARYHSSRVTEDQIRIVVKRLLQWPPPNLLPVLDLLRLLFVHTHAAETLASLKFTPSIFEILYTIASDSSFPTNSMLALRTFANIFKIQGARRLVEFNQLQLLSLLQSTSISDNKNIAHASATILLNLSVSYRTQPNAEGLVQALSILRAVFAQATLPPDVLLRAVIAAGTLASMPIALNIVRSSLPLPVLLPLCSSSDASLSAAAQELTQLLS